MENEECTGVGSCENVNAGAVVGSDSLSGFLPYAGLHPGEQ